MEIFDSLVLDIKALNVANIMVSFYSSTIWTIITRTLVLFVPNKDNALTGRIYFRGVHNHETGIYRIIYNPNFCKGARKILHF